ncbi:MAG: FAD:protein FMN transferase [Rhodanobacter sp.]
MFFSRLAICLLVLFSSAASAKAAQLLHLDGQTMGTTWSVQVVPPPTVSPAELQRGIQTELDRVDGQMSTYKAESDLSRFNGAPGGTWQTLPPEFFGVLQHALQLAKDSHGAYDPTVGPLVNLWGFGPDQRPRHPPNSDAINHAKSRVGWWKLKLDRAGLRAWQPGGIYLDLSAVAKGFSVDQVGRYLRQRGADSWLVEVGGELKAHGRKPGGRSWQVGIEQPDAAAGAVSRAEELVRTISLDDRAIATSGDYRHVFEDGGHIYSHHIDPRSGYPVPHEVASVSVLADDCIQADPLGTALSVLGAERGMAYAREHGLAVLMIVRTAQGFEQRMSPAFVATLRR